MMTRAKILKELCQGDFLRRGGADQAVLVGISQNWETAISYERDTISRLAEYRGASPVPRNLLPGTCHIL